MPPVWSSVEDDMVVDGHGDSIAYDSTREEPSKSVGVSVDDDSNSTRARIARKTLPLRTRLLKRPRLKQISVPPISTTSLFNRLQTSSVVVVDCRSATDYAHAHIRGALHCEHGRRSRHKTVDDVLSTVGLDHTSSFAAAKLQSRDMMEIVVVGSNRTSSSLLNRMDGGYRFAKLMLKEGRVFSVMFLSAGFHAFALKYPFILQSSSSSIDSTATATSPVHSIKSPSPNDEDEDRLAHDCASTLLPPVLQYPNEIVDEFLYLGNFWQANNAQIVADLRITHIINMGAITDDRNKFDHVEYLDVAIKDRESVDIRKEFAHTIAFIQHASQQRGARVLIHCVQGVSRSSTIVIWYLMLETQCTLSAAYSYVLKRRPLIFPNRGFMKQLMANEKELYGYESVLPQELDLLQHGLLPPLDRKGSALRLSLSDK